MFVNKMINQVRVHMVTYFIIGCAWLSLIINLLVFMSQLLNEEGLCKLLYDNNDEDHRLSIIYTNCLI